MAEEVGGVTLFFPSFFVGNFLPESKMVAGAIGVGVFFAAPTFFRGRLFTEFEEAAGATGEGDFAVDGIGETVPLIRPNLLAPFFVFDGEVAESICFAFVWDVFSAFDGPLESPFVEVAENVFTEGDVFVFAFDDEEFFLVDDDDGVSFLAVTIILEEDLTDDPMGVTGFGKDFDDVISIVFEDLGVSLFLLEEETTLSEDDDDDDVGDCFVIPFATLCFAAIDGLPGLFLVLPLEPEDVRSLADELFDVDMLTRSPTIDDFLELDGGELVLDSLAVELLDRELELALGLLLVGVD